MRWPEIRDWVFALKSFGAAALALYIAFVLELDRPYWAFLTSFIVAQPFSGMVRSKAMYRFIGTFIGAGATIVLIPNFVNAPELLCLVLALWIGGCVYAAELVEPPKNYAFLLSGYTAAIIGFPSVSMPEMLFDNALNRVEEISLGIACAFVVHELIFPRAIGPQMRAGLTRWLKAASVYITDILARRPITADQRHLAASVSQLATLRVHAMYDTPGLRAAAVATQVLQNRMRVVLLLMFALNARLQKLEAVEDIQSDSVDQAVEWFEKGVYAPAAAAPSLAAALRSTAGKKTNALQISAFEILALLVTRWGECLDHYWKTMRGERVARQKVEGGARHLDYGRALFAMLTTVISLLLCCAIWIYGSWPEGGSAATMTGITCCLFTTRDEAALGARSFARWLGLGGLMAGVYLFVVMPQIDGFPLLLFVLAVVLIPTSVLMANPVTAGSAMPFLFGMCGLLAIQETYTADPLSWANGGLAQFLGCWIASLVLVFIRSNGVVWILGRLHAANRNDLVRIARGQYIPDPDRFASRMLDRIVAIAPRISSTPGGEMRSMRDLRLGLNLIALQKARHGLPRSVARDVGVLLGTLAQFIDGKRAVPLQRRLMRAEATLSKAEPGASVMRARVALAGIRLALSDSDFAQFRNAP